MEVDTKSACFDSNRFVAKPHDAPCVFSCCTRFIHAVHQKWLGKYVGSNLAVSCMQVVKQCCKTKRISSELKSKPEKNKTERIKWI